MPIDAHMNIGGIRGESLDTPMEGTEVVRSGENSLAQVANRLDINQERLASANPQIRDPQNLKIGQELYLPTRPASRTSETGSEAQHPPVLGKDLPKAPIGEPFNASLIKASLTSLTLQDAELDKEKTRIGEMKQEAQEKYNNEMNAATSEMTLGVVSAGLQISGTKDTTQDVPGHELDKRVSKP